MEKTAVLIVGAGPVGLTAAVFCSHLGIPFRIIDKKAEPTKTSNAAGVHARTLELLNIIGLADAFVRKGQVLNRMCSYANTKLLASVETKYIENSLFPFILCLPQNETEAILIDYLTQHQQVVHRNCELISLSQTDEKVTASIKTSTGELIIEADFVMGCDGYHSTVRDILKIPYQGQELGNYFLMIDAPLQWNIPQDQLSVFFDRDITLATFPMLQSTRIIAEVTHAPKYKAARQDQVMPDEKVFTEIFQQCLPGLAFKIEPPRWASHFYIHEFLAKNYRQGRIFIAGDAAHTHSPFGGQGMNTGMQDAINLVWKLAAVLSKQAPLTLLDSYEMERRAVAKEVLADTTKLTRLATVRNSLLIQLRNFLFPKIMKLTSISKKMITKVSELSVNYHHSPIVKGKYLGCAKPGDRLPHLNFTLSNHVTDTTQLLIQNPYRHILLVFSDDMQNPLPENLQKEITAVHIAKNSPEIKKYFGSTNLMCLIRPDGYIGYLGCIDDRVNLMSYLKQFFAV
jgi:2-polyprenyl-6-methoxyphenol hydroxylase-like FAD-dependent oxidoreductase